MKAGSKEPLVVALGGNALFRHGEGGTFEEQQENINETSRHLSDLIQEGHRLVITHGNGPQVGATLLRHEAGKKYHGVPPLPMYVAVAETQGFIGYLIQQSLRSELKRRKIEKTVVTIITRVIVDKEDPELRNPSKPVGPFLTQDELSEARKDHPNFSFIKDKARGGWRRVVPSPDPVRIAIAEQSSIKYLVERGTVVIACGGGGIPTIEKEGWRAEGIEAVIDKDLAGERLAALIEADKLVILTDVEGVYLDYGSAKQRMLGTISASEARRYLKSGAFSEGTMAPKVLAAARFAEECGKEAIIAELSEMLGAVSGNRGTHIVPDMRSQPRHVSE